MDGNFVDNPQTDGEYYRDIFGSLVLILLFLG